MENLKASVQYGDWQGTAAADDGHDVQFQSLLKEKGIVGEGAYVVAIRFYTGENFDKPWLRAVIADGSGHDDVNAQINAVDTLRFKEVEVELSLEEFFLLFKRFSIVLTSRGLGLEGHDYQVI